MKKKKPEPYTLDQLTVLATNLMRLSLVVVALFSWARGDYFIVFISVLTFVLLFAPAFFQHKYGIKLPIYFEFSIVLFLYASMFLGEVGLYAKLWWWDSFLHGFGSIGMGLIGFTIIYYIYKLRKLLVSPFLFAVFTFAFTLCFGALWEIFEFIIDTNFGTHMQRNGLHDTMWDLIIDSLGALVTSIYAYIYVKSKSKGIFARLMKTFLKDNPRYK